MNLLHEPASTCPELPQLDAERAIDIYRLVEKNQLFGILKAI